MNNTLKKVLSYIGVGLLGSLIGIGALIGVSSCSSINGNDQQEKQVKEAKAETYDSYYQIDSSVFGRSVWYGDYWDYFRFDDFSATSSSFVIQIFLGNESIYSIGTDIGYFDSIFLNINRVPNTDNISIAKCQLRKGSVDYNVYFDGAFTVSNSYLRINRDNKPYLLWTDNSHIIESYKGGFFDCIAKPLAQDSSQVTQFEFAKQINYYAPYGDNISSFAVNDGDMQAPNSFRVYEYNLPVFYSGGYIWNKVVVRYINAVALRWYDSEGKVQTFGQNSFASYMWMEYQNTITNKILVVNSRNSETYEIVNGMTQVTINSSSWLSNDFRNLLFFQEPSSEQKLNLSQFNNNIYGDSFQNTTTDVGLGNVFQLLSLAFASWIPILSIQIVPGITIGLLMFLPLIAGIIVLVIWIVKR